MLDVILCTYNSENTINKCVDSILNQTFTDFTLHIFDDSSNDSTIELLKKYKDTRLRIIRSPKNVGTYAGKNYILRNFFLYYLPIHNSEMTFYNLYYLHVLFLVQMKCPQSVYHLVYYL